jgi:uncharacterized hydrophobic protein (TIGR00271 family)
MPAPSAASGKDSTPPSGSGGSERILVPISGESQAISIIPVVARIANARGAELVLFYFHRAYDEEDDPAPPAWLAVAARHVREHGAPARIIARAGQDRISALLEMVAEERPSLLVLAPGEDESASERFRRLFLNPPVDTLLMRGSRDGRAVRRVLVFSESAGGAGSLGVRLATELDDGTGDLRLDFLEVLPTNASEEQQLARRGMLAAHIAERKLRCDYDVRVVRARSREAGLLDAIRTGDYDLVLADTPRRGLIRWLAERVFPSRVLEQTDVPVMFISRPVPRTVSSFTSSWNRVYGMLPSLSETDKIATYSNLRRSSRADTDFYVMLILSTAIAALGLLLNSAAIVIGAMIIAPLMAPLIATGLGVVQGDGRLLRISLQTVVLGAIVSVTVAAIVGFVLPGQVVTPQIEARGQPSLLDLLVALFSGAAGAYAVSRKSVANTVAGVAIAVALVPPLASAGLGVALRDYTIAGGATLLFLTNFAAIGASSSLIFLWMGFKPETDRAGRMLVFVRGIVTLAGLIALVSVGLFTFQQADETRLALRVDRAVEDAVTRVDPDGRITGIDIGSRHEAVLRLDVRVESTERERLRANAFAIQSEVSQRLDRPVQVTMFIADSIVAPTPQIDTTPTPALP